MTAQRNLDLKRCKIHSEIKFHDDLCFYKLLFITFTYCDLTYVILSFFFKLIYPSCSDPKIEQALIIISNFPQKI